MPFMLAILLEEEEEEDEEVISCLIGVKVSGLRALWAELLADAATAEIWSRSGLSGTVTQLITFFRTLGEPKADDPDLELQLPLSTLLLFWT